MNRIICLRIKTEETKDQGLRNVVLISALDIAFEKRLLAGQEWYCVPESRVPQVKAFLMEFSLVLEAEVPVEWRTVGELESAS